MENHQPTDSSEKRRMTTEIFHSKQKTPGNNNPYGRKYLQAKILESNSEGQAIPKITFPEKVAHAIALHVRGS